MFGAHTSWLGMDRRLKVSLVAGALLAGGGAWYGLHGSAPARLEVAQLPAPRSNLEHCLYSARMIFDVHWAAACTAEAEQGVPGADGHAECDLGGDRAAAVNAWLDKAEARCRAEAP
jgi:hypothetical protein